MNACDASKNKTAESSNEIAVIEECLNELCEQWPRKTITESERITAFRCAVKGCNGYSAVHHTAIETLNQLKQTIISKETYVINMALDYATQALASAPSPVVCLCEMHRCTQEGCNRVKEPSSMLCVICKGSKCADVIGKGSAYLAG